eukprot:15366158-Ditylum_brightwellii.AAC.1
MLPKPELSFFGREKELQQLRDLFSIFKQDGTSEVIFVSGPTGSGKATLVEKAFKEEKCLYGVGQFEAGEMKKPFTSLAHCVLALVQAILDADAACTEKYAKLIKSSLTPQDAYMLELLTPEARLIVPEYARQGDKFPKPGSKECFEYCKYTIRIFLRAIAVPERPVVLFMNNLQWVDKTTIDILKSIIFFPDVQHCFIVGAYKHEDVGPDHMLSKWIEEDAINTIDLKQFEPDQLYEILVEILGTKDNVQELARLFYSRTNGNIHHIIQLMEFIKNHQNPKLLEYSPTQFRYTWRIRDIRQYTSISNSIVGIIVTNISLLPDEVQSFLKLASCFGTRIDQRILLVVEGEYVSNHIETVIEEGLLERLSENIIKFSHDNVHQAAMRLFSDEECQQMRFEIGKKLLDHYCGENDEFIDIDDTGLFTCVDLLNIGKERIKDEDFRLRLAKLNYKAVVRAASFSAFIAAIQYAETSISLLDKNTMWTENYEFCLELHNTLAEMCSYCGQIERLSSSAKEVFDNSKTIEDQLRSHFALLERGGVDTHTGNHDVINQIFELIKRLGVDVPRRNTTESKAEASKKRTFNLVEALSDEDILALPKTKNRKQAASTRLIVILSRHMMRNKMWNMLITLASDALATSLEYGLCEYSPLIFAFYGKIIISYDKDIRVGCRIGLLAQLLLEKLESSSSVRIETSMHTKFVNHWKQPLSLSLERRISGYQEGLKIGNLYGAFYNITLYGMEYFYSGLSLPPLVDDVKRFLDQMGSYNFTRPMFLNLPLYQTALNLTGQSDNVLGMFTAKTSEYYHQKYKWDGIIGLEIWWSYGMQIAFICDEIEIASAYADNLKRVGEKTCMLERVLYFEQVRAFFYALIAIDQYRKTGKQKFFHEADKYKLSIEECIKGGSFNLLHKLQILEAEFNSVNKPNIIEKSLKTLHIGHLKKTPSEKNIVSAKSLQMMYDKAISSSRRTGFLQDVALTALLASKSVEVGDDRYHVAANEALESWGATAVIRCLQVKRSLPKKDSAESDTTPIGQIKGYRATKRFIEGIQKEGSEFLNVDNPFSNGEYFQH